MQKWRLIAIVVVMAAILVAGGLALLRGEGPRVTKANYRRIHEGMTRAEVEQILGPPCQMLGGDGGWAFTIVYWRFSNRSITMAFQIGNPTQDAHPSDIRFERHPDIAQVIDPY